MITYTLRDEIDLGKQVEFKICAPATKRINSYGSSVSNPLSNSATIGEPVI
ncbi:MAG: hypothetical protein ACI9RO_001349 [Alteromonas macleodii]|jgi:hypothetical protein